MRRRIGVRNQVVAKLVCFSIVFATAALAGEVNAQPPKKDAGTAESVRNSSDTVHLKWQLLRSWNELDLNPLPRRKSLPKGFKPLWESVLSSTDRELRRNALLSIGQAHAGGYEDFSDVAESVRKTFNRDDLRPATRIDAARTLVILDARAAAPDLMKHLESSRELRKIAERAFAEWDFAPGRDLWMQRLEKAEAVPRSHLMLALRGLAQVGHKAAADPVRAIVLSSDFDSGVRLTAARTLADLRTSGLEDTSTQLLADGENSAIVPGLLAASLLRRHSGEAPEAILSRLLEHSSPAVAAVAWERLDELNPDGIEKDLVEKTLRSRDARLRLLAVRNCSHRSEQLIDPLQVSLDDHHPDVRCLSRHTLRDWADQAAEQNNPAVVKQIRRAATAALASESWRGTEQACLLVSELDDKQAAAALVPILHHKRDEAASSAAYALKELAVASQLPQMLVYADRLDQALASSPGRARARAEIVQTHLFESFAELKYGPADSLLRKYIPKSPPRYDTPFCRMAAIRSLAYLNGGKPDAELDRMLTARMFDRSLIMPESDEVIMACALAFGIMERESKLSDLRKLVAEMGPDVPAGRAAYWSINRLTGEPIPPKTRLIQSRSRWFLAPLSRDSK